ncbi:MAG: rhodanese-like domain-containing protein, partial [Ottowia sp.]|nr:rhodanese-like domain-containing protein [Ottowia sp.]
MDFIANNWMWLLLAVASGTMLLIPGPGGAGLNCSQVVQLINHEKAVIIDVCGAEEFAQGHIAGAKNIRAEEFESKLPEAVKNKKLPLVMVCASGMRAARAAALAKKLGYENAQVLAGGMQSWREAQLPVE